MKGKADSSKKGDGRLKAGGGAAKRKKAAASGKPKRPPSAFFVFMSEFRQEYNAQHPDNKSVAAVSKAAGEKWRAISEETISYMAERVMGTGSFDIVFQGEDQIRKEQATRSDWMRISCIQ